MDQYSSFGNRPQRPHGQWANGPAFSQNAAFLPNNHSTCGPGPKNRRNGNWNPQFQYESQDNHFHGQKSKNKKKYNRGGNFSGPQNSGGNQRQNHNWPNGPRQFNKNSHGHDHNQSRRPSQNDQFQHPARQSHWKERSNQGGNNGNNRRNNKNNRNRSMLNAMSNQENWQPVNDGRDYHQKSYQQISPYSIEDDFSTIIAEANPLYSPGIPLLYGPIADADIEMPDAPPLEKTDRDYQMFIDTGSMSIYTPGFQLQIWSHDGVLTHRLVE